MSPQPPPRRLRCTMSKTIGHESPPPTPSHVALTSSAYIAPAGYIPFAHPAASTVAVRVFLRRRCVPRGRSPARPVRRRALRRLASVERHLGLDVAASASSPASSPAGA
ncbi:hypothetical protein FB451DRAFT_1418252 [Mycena latifolia]|nr:hypothetical protein FB451DRAFT_1418252 [Mycena latifolia]